MQQETPTSLILPNELWQHIFSFLSDSQLLSTLRSCKLFFEFLSPRFIDKKQTILQHWKKQEWQPKEFTVDDSVREQIKGKTVLSMFVSKHPENQQQATSVVYLALSNGALLTLLLDPKSLHATLHHLDNTVPEQHKGMVLMSLLNDKYFAVLFATRMLFVKNIRTGAWCKRFHAPPMVFDEYSKMQSYTFKFFAPPEESEAATTTTTASAPASRTVIDMLLLTQEQVLLLLWIDGDTIREVSSIQHDMYQITGASIRTMAWNPTLKAIESEVISISQYGEKLVFSLILSYSSKNRQLQQISCKQTKRYQIPSSPVDIFSYPEKNRVVYLSYKCIEVHEMATDKRLANYAFDELQCSDPKLQIIDSAIYDVELYKRRLVAGSFGCIYVFEPKSPEGVISLRKIIMAKVKKPVKNVTASREILAATVQDSLELYYLGPEEQQK